MSGQAPLVGPPVSGVDKVIGVDQAPPGSTPNFFGLSCCQY